MDSIPNEVIIAHIMPHLGLNGLLSVLRTNSRLRKLTYEYADKLDMAKISSYLYDKHLMLFRKKRKLTIGPNNKIIGHGLVYLMNIVELRLEIVDNIQCGLEYLYVIRRLELYYCKRTAAFLAQMPILWNNRRRMQYMEITGVVMSHFISNNCNGLKILMLIDCTIVPDTFKYLTRVENIFIDYCRFHSNWPFSKLIAHIKPEQKVEFSECPGLVIDGTEISPNITIKPADDPVYNYLTEDEIYDNDWE
jgi:hypothetical protein